jgi:Adenylate and Guanylate cyclase catalytic domain
VTRLETRETEPLAVRIGIATGLVVVGDLVGDLVGEGSAQEQAVIGETPNLAARLQALAEPGQIVVAGVTRRLIGDLFRLRDLGRQALRGCWWWRPLMPARPTAAGKLNIQLFGFFVRLLHRDDLFHFKTSLTDSHRFRIYYTL